MVLVIVMSVVVTGLIMSVAWAAGVQGQITGNLMKVDAAFYASEAGAQRAAWYLKTGKTVAQPLTGTIGGYSYSVTWVSAGGSYRVTSVGTSGAAQNTVLMTVTPPATAPQAALSAANSLSLKNLTVTGDVLVGQDITFQPGNAQIIGNLTYGTNLNGSPSVTGTTAKGSFTGVNWSNLDTALKAASGLNYASAQSGKTFDFSALSGNKVIYVNGDVTNPSFVGTGTLYVNGKITLNGDLGTLASPVNLVSTQEITTANNSTVYGSIYAKTNWNRGKIDLTGMVYLDGSINDGNSGSSKITFTSTPWFDNRTASGVSGSATQFTSFAGVKP
jgi:hypothetical protein